LNAGALLQLAGRSPFPYDKNYNPSCKPVFGFQNLLKKCCSLHQKFSHKKSRLYQTSLNNNSESPNDGHLHSRNSLWTGFIILTASAMNSVLYVDKARYTTVQMEK